MPVDLTFRLVQHGAAHVRPVGGVAVHLLFQRVDVPHQRLALLLFAQIQVLVALAQLVNFQAVLAFHRQGIGDVHRGVELFELDQMRLQRLIQRQHDLARSLVDGRRTQPTEHRDFLRTRQADPLHLGVGNILNVLFDLLVHRAVVRINAAQLQKLVDGHLVPGQLGVAGLDHRKDVQHQLLLAQCQAVHGVLDQIIALAHNGLPAAPAEGRYRDHLVRHFRLRIFGDLAVIRGHTAYLDCFVNFNIVCNHSRLCLVCQLL